tara:strand:- start:4586 stop:5380 length:795 start_codon:yes stop_codon:yes gene_type:complete
MPEGPEVKIASDYLNKSFKKKERIKFNILSNYYNNKYNNIFETISKEYKSFTESFTIGKNIFIELKGKKKLHIHLGMTGKWCDTNIKHCHFEISSKQKKIFFNDVRKFGGIQILEQDNFCKKYFKEYDLLNPKYNYEKHILKLNSINTKKSVCKILLDQTYFPGVGNYIKSETLYASGIHPEEKWGNICGNKLHQLIRNTKFIMQKSYDNGGAELKDFSNPFKKSTFKLKIYGRKKTETNQNIISVKTSDSRTTWICKQTQKKS